MSIRKKLITLLLIYISSIFAQNDSLEVKFESAYKQWVEAGNGEYKHHPWAWGGKEATMRIYNLGHDVIPLLIKKLDEDYNSNSGLELILMGLTGARPPMEKNVSDEEERWVYYEKRWSYWWNNMRKNLPDVISKNLNEYEVLKSKRDVKGAEKQLKKIDELGYDTLPYLIDYVKNGKIDLIPVISKITRTNNEQVDLPKTSTKDECLIWWKENKDRFIMPSIE